MKLSDWAKKQGIAYLTAYRWFKDGKLPVQAYQSDSGTIIVQDESENLEQQMASGNNQNNDVMSLFLKKTVEFSKNNASIEDFAAFILSNFTLKPQASSETPKYSKNKPKTEDVQKHFQKFIPEKESIDHLKMIKTLIKDNKSNVISEVKLSGITESVGDDLGLLTNSLSTAFVAPTTSAVHLYDQTVEGVVSRNVELESTPQQFSYTGSTNITPLNSFSIDPNTQLYPSIALQEPEPLPEPTVTVKRKRGRKPMNKSGSNQ